MPIQPPNSQNIDRDNLLPESLANTTSTEDKPTDSKRNNQTSIEASKITHRATAICSIQTSTKTKSDHIDSSRLDEKSTRLREVIVELIKANGLPKYEAEREIRTILANNATMLLWAFETEYLKDIVDNAELLNLPPETSAIIELFDSSTSVIFRYFTIKGVQPVLLDPSTLAKELLMATPETLYTPINEEIGSCIKNAKFSDSEEIKMMLDPDNGFDMTQIPELLQKFFTIVLTEYFDRLPVTDKSQILINILSLPLKATVTQKLAATLFGAGPVIQKAFQLFGEDAKSAEVLAVMRELKSNIKPFPIAQARLIIEKELNGKIDEIFEKFDPEPIAAATIGQVYRAMLSRNDKTDEEVIIKVLRPGLKDKARREIDLLKSLAPADSLKKFVERLEDSVFEELDLRIEAKNMEDGAAYVRPEKGIGQVYLTHLPTTMDVLVMESACGLTMNNLGEDCLKLKLEALSELLAVWYDEAIFGSGFFHGDLHAGNIFFLPEPMVNYAPLGRNYQLTLIDFGCAAKLSANEKKALIRLSIACARRSPEAVVSSLKSIIPMTEQESSRMNSYVTRVLSEAKNDLEAIDGIINSAVDAEIFLPRNLILFIRGKKFLEKQIQETNNQLDNHDPAGKTKKASIINIYREAMLTRFYKVLPTLNPWS